MHGKDGLDQGVVHIAEPGDRLELGRIDQAVGQHRLVDVDPDHAAEIARQVRTGVVTVNSAAVLDMASPFGGFKKSGIGRELGPEGLEPFCEVQSILLPAG